MTADSEARRLYKTEMARPACLDDTVAACVAHMRADPAAIPSALAGRERLLANIDALSGYEVFRHPY